MRKTIVIAVAGLVAAGAFVFPTNAGPEHKNKYSSETRDVTDSTCDRDEVLVEAVGAAKIWPPNHKDVPVSVRLTDVNDANNDDQVSLTVFGTHDELAEDGTEMNGSGNTPAEGDVPQDEITATGTHSVTIDFTVRAERSGRGDGRTYTISYKATYQDGDGGDPATCPEGDDVFGTFTIEVPHDMGRGAENKKVHQP